MVVDCMTWLWCRYVLVMVCPQLETLAIHFMFVFENTANEQLFDNVHSIFTEHCTFFLHNLMWFTPIVY